MQKRAGGEAQGHLYCKCEALSSNPSTTKKKNYSFSTHLIRLIANVYV
jgi:hypothetical protein